MQAGTRLISGQDDLGAAFYINGGDYIMIKMRGTIRRALSACLAVAVAVAVGSGVLILSGCYDGNEAGKVTEGNTSTLKLEEDYSMEGLIIQSSTGKSRDPWVIFHDGYYYHCYSKDGAIGVSKSKNLNEVGETEGIEVFRPDEGKIYSKNLWAPELHIIDDKCYIYFAADNGNNAYHRMYVLYNESDDPMQPYKLYGMINDGTNRWAIDGTVLQHESGLYFIWSGWEGYVNTAQNLYIAKMNNPLEIGSERVLLSSPKYDWEKAGGDGTGLPFINEGPAALIKGDTVHVVYSGGGSWSNNYCLGMLTFRGGDIMNPADWAKSEKPVFESNEFAKGPGHCSFTTVGATDYICYHAFDRDASEGWGSASSRAQAFSWDGDVPVFGEPIDVSDQMK